MDLPHPRHARVGVDLGRGQTGVAEQLLHRAQVGQREVMLHPLCPVGVITVDSILARQLSACTPTPPAV